MTKKMLVIVNTATILLLLALMVVTKSALPLSLLTVSILSFLVYIVNPTEEKSLSESQEVRCEEKTTEEPSPKPILRDKRETDSLTGLYTRSYFIRNAEELIEKGEQEFSIFSIDLNKFKIINDLQGHHIGDVVLKEIGTRLKALNNKTLFFARFGGDEFVALFLSTSDNKISEVGNHIKETIRQRITHDKFEYEVGASIGVARYPDDAQTLTDLLKLADFAMYYAKRNDLTDLFLITEEFNKQFAKRKHYEKLLRDLDTQKNELMLYFQPHFSLQANELVGVEIIVKWHHPTEGILEGDEFLPISEEMGIIQHITKWTFLNALAQIKEWNDKYNRELTVNLNVSQSCMYHRIFFTNVSHMIDAFQIKPYWLRISLSEFSVMHAPEYIKKLLHSILNLGAEISVTDFGSGQICIGLLKYIYAKYLKTDASIVHELEYDKNTYDTLKGIILMAEGMGIKTIVKGVENSAQLNILRDLNCDIVLGSYLGEPALKEEFEKRFLEDNENMVVAGQ